MLDVLANKVSALQVILVCEEHEEEEGVIGADRLMTPLHVLLQLVGEGMEVGILGYAAFTGVVGSFECLIDVLVFHLPGLDWGYPPFIFLNAKPLAVEREP